MKKRLWIIIAATVLAVAVAVVLFFLLEGKPTSTKGSDGPFTCSYRQSGKSIKVTIAGQFSKNSWIAESGNEEVLAVTTLKNARKSATFQISPVAGGMESAYFTFSASDSEYDGYEVIADVLVDEDGKVNFVAFRQRQGSAQNLSGSTGEFDYICRVDQSKVEVVLTSEKPVEWAYEIEEDSFLTIESVIIQELAEGETETPDSTDGQTAGTVSTETASSENEEVTRTDNDEILEQMAALGYSKDDLEELGEEKIFSLIEENYPEEDDSATEDETSESAEEASGSTETHFTFTANGTGNVELVRLCSSSLTKALEITVQGSMDGTLEISKVEEVKYTYYALADSLQARMDAYALIGVDSLPNGFVTTDYAVDTIGEAQVVSFTATIDGMDWEYRMSKECSVDTMAENTLGGVLQKYSTQWNGTDVAVYTLENGIAASWQKDDLACLLYRAAEVVSYDENGEEIVEVLTQQQAVSAASTAIANLGKGADTETVSTAETDEVTKSQTTAITEKSVP